MGHYDKSGRSLGTAEISYDRKSDAVKAMKQYNGVPLDGKAMRIEIAGTGADVSEAPLRRVGGMGCGRIGRRDDRQSPRRTGGGGGGRRAGRGGGGGGGGRAAGGGRGGRGGGGSGAPREKKQEVSKDKLDEEMEEYMKSKN